MAYLTILQQTDVKLLRIFDQLQKSSETRSKLLMKILYSSVVFFSCCPFQTKNPHMLPFFFSREPAPASQLPPWESSLTPPYLSALLSQPDQEINSTEKIKLLFLRLAITEFSKFDCAVQASPPPPPPPYSLVLLLTDSLQCVPKLLFLKVISQFWT